MKPMRLRNASPRRRSTMLSSMRSPMRSRLVAPLLATLLLMTTGFISSLPPAIGAGAESGSEPGSASGSESPSPFGMGLGFQTSRVHAAPFQRALPQPASRTATPRISLPTSSPDPSVSATPTLARSVSTPSDGGPGPTASPAEPGGDDGGDGDNPSRPGGAGTGSDEAAAGGGSNPNSPGAGSSSNLERGGALESDNPDNASGFREDLPPFPWSNPASLTRFDPAAPAPRGLVAAPVSDPGIRQLWADSGSPRQGQRMSERLTEGRPGPWGFSLFYLLLAILFAWASRRAWRALDGAAGEA